MSNGQLLIPSFSPVLVEQSLAECGAVGRVSVAGAVARAWAARA